MKRSFTTGVLAFSVVPAMAVASMAHAVDPTCCCSAHATPSCSDASCSSTVCAIDPYCCNSAWDGTCAYEAAQYCGAASPYCLDSNQNGIFDVCESGGGGGGTDPADCDGDGTPDLNETGYYGKSWWIGATSGSGIPFEDGSSWTFGRPGTATLAEVTVPYTQYYNSLQLMMGCDNAARSFTLLDDGTSVLHDFELHLGGRTLRLAGPSSTTLRFTPRFYSTLRAFVASGDILATDTGLSLVDDGAIVIGFDGVTVHGGAFSWSSTVASETPKLQLVDSTLDVASFSWPQPIFGVGVSPMLTLQDSTIQLQQGAAGGATTFSVPDTGWLRVNSYEATELAKISGGAALQVAALPGSLLDLNGRLTIEGAVGLGGALQGRSHCLPYAQMCSASVLTVQNLTYPASSNASWTWGVDLSGGSGSTPDGDASVRVTGTASIDGPLVINDLSNGAPLQLGLTIPLVWAGGFAQGHDNFELVRTFGMDQMALPVGYFVSTERSGGTINLVVKRGSPVASNAPVNSPIATPPTRMTVVDDGSRFGLPLVAYATPNGQGTTISLRKINASQGSVIPYATISAPSDLTDMVAADLTNDGVPELVASFGASGQVRAYTLGTTPSLLWNCQLPRPTRAECLGVIPGSGSSLLPPSPTVGVGTSSGSKGGIGTIDAGGGFSGATEIAIIPKSLNGTDIDNDDDSDIVAGGEDTSSASLTGPTLGAVQIFRREATGSYTTLPKVATPGVPTAIVVGDLDGDGRKDVVASCNQVTGTFATGQRPTGVVLRGAPAYGYGSTASLLRSPVALDVGSSYAQGTGVSLVDADGDGFLDIALSWQDTGGSSGGAAIFPVREQRASGGLSLGAQLNFAGSAVTQMRQLGSSSVVTLRTAVTALTGSASLVQDDFTAAPVLGDLDGDGYVTNADVALLLLEFGPCPGVPCDADLDGTAEVDMGDLAFMLLLFS